MEGSKHKNISLLLSIFGPAVALIVTYTTLSNTVKHQGERLDRLESLIQDDRELYLKKFEALDVKFADIQVRLAEIHKDILYLTQESK